MIRKPIQQSYTSAASQSRCDLGGLITAVWIVHLSSTYSDADNKAYKPLSKI